MTATRRPSILLVDDKPERLLTYVAILETLELDLVQARSGEEALVHVETTDFAAILLDIKMPGLNGFDTATRIRECRRGAKTPIIFVSGIHVSELDRLRGYEIGAADYVFVPVVPEILRAKIQVLVRLYEQQLEMSRLNAELLTANNELGRVNRQLMADNMRELKKLNESLALANGKLQSEIAERRRAEQRLKDGARRKDEFISILAHELRNPLSAIHSGIELMRLPSLTESKLSWARDLVDRQLRHLVRIVDDLLDVSRVTSGRVQLKKEIVDLRTVVTDSVDATRVHVEERGHDLELTLPDEPVYVDGDTVRLGQVFGNLLANATKYMDQGGRIEVSVEPGEGAKNATVRIRDYGAGLRPEMLDHIFELFTQIEPTGSRAQSGLGIGLALVKSLVNLHDGTVRASSEGPDLGSEFTVELPHANACPVEIEEPGDGRRSPGLRLLIVDDNVDAAVTMAELFRQVSAHEVQLAHNGADGLAAAEAFEPDAIFLDIGLPDIDGHEVARRLQSRPHLADIPLIAITGFGRDFDRERARRAGFAHFLPKPVAFSDLERVLSLYEERGRASGRPRERGGPTGAGSRPSPSRADGPPCIAAAACAALTVDAVTRPVGKT